jgi:hypothetical protein
MISRACLDVIFLQDFITIFTLSLSSVESFSLVVFDSFVVIADVCISLIGIDFDVDFAIAKIQEQFPFEKVKEMFIIDELKSLMKKNSDKALLSLYFEKIAFYRYL